MDDTLNQIHRLANERHMLYRQAAKQELTPQQQQHIREITDNLTLLWDKHRREFAAGHRYQQPAATRTAA